MTEADKVRRAEGYVGINGVNVWGDIKKYVTDIEFTEVASGETDSFDITMIDEEGHFINDWLIDTGTELNAKFKLLNWTDARGEFWIDCGTFLCDALKVRGFPYEVQIMALALPVCGTKNTKKWEKISISAIAQDICNWLGCELKYYADDITLKSQQQSRQTDIDFLYSLCNEYGLGMKAYRNSIVIFDRERQDAAAAVETISLKKIKASFTLDDNEDLAYTGAQCNYKPEKSDKELTYTYGSTERLLILDTSATSAKEAELKAKAALYAANSERVKLKFTTLGGLISIYPGTNYYITDLGGYSGKYAIDRVAHKLSGKDAYKISVEAHAVQLEKDGAADSAAEITEITGGRAVTLNNSPLYISNDASNPVRHITGTYYLYDGKNFNGRYRICNKDEVGKTPINANVTGYINGSDIK